MKQVVSPRSAAIPQGRPFAVTTAQLTDRDYIDYFSATTGRGRKQPPTTGFRPANGPPGANAVRLRGELQPAHRFDSKAAVDRDCPPVHAVAPDRRNAVNRK